MQQELCLGARISGDLVMLDAVVAIETPSRLPRFRRAAEPPAYRLTENDVEIVR
jgi:hypothetical protein